MIHVDACRATAGRPLGVLSLSGGPEQGYSLRLGLTGVVLASGEPDQILEALKIVMGKPADEA